MNNQIQIPPLLAALLGQLATPAPAAPAAAPAPAAPASTSQTVKVTGGVNAFKSVSKGFNKDKWMCSIGDLTFRWNPNVLPKSAFVASSDKKGVRHTRERWDITIGVNPNGRIYAASAVNTNEPYLMASEGLDDIGDESLDTEETAAEEDNL